MLLPLIVNKNDNIYLPDYRNLDFRIVEEKLDSLGFVSQIIYKDYSKNYMGLRSKRFAMVAEDKKINIMNIEQPGEYKVSAAEYIMNQI